MTRFVHIHASGRFNQLPAEFAAGLKLYRAVASVVTVTEVDNNARARLLATDGWEGVWGDKGPRDDCGITWDPKIWDKVYADTIEVSTARYKDDRGQLANITVPAFAVLRHKATGHVVVFGVLHTPHGMQEELKNHNVHTDVGKAYVSITTGYKRTAFHLKRQYKADAVNLSGDWNMNIRLMWARLWLKTYSSARGLKLNWTNQLPLRGTHGKEIIDATLFTGLELVGTPFVLDANKGDDHVAYKQTFNLL